MTLTVYSIYGLEKIFLNPASASINIIDARSSSLSKCVEMKLGKLNFNRIRIFCAFNDVKLIQDFAHFSCKF